jgi:hypothetical protein
MAGDIVVGAGEHQPALRRDRHEGVELDRVADRPGQDDEPATASIDAVLSARCRVDIPAVSQTRKTSGTSRMAPFWRVRIERPARRPASTPSAGGPGRPCV